MATRKLGVAESAGMLPITVVLTGETGQTFGQQIEASVQGLLTGTALRGVHYELAADAEVVFPAGSAVGATRTFTISLVDNFTADPTRTI